MIRRLVISNGRSERELLLVGSIVIGRDPACHVSEPDPLLSRRHAEILANIHGVSIRDLDSRNGILVNGEKTSEQILLPGDVVQMGHLQLRYVEDNARPSDTMMNRGSRREGPAAPPPAPQPPSFDRFRPEPTPSPRRWRPEPTPLPGRRTTTVPPPSSYSPSQTPVPRGRAAFDPSAAAPRPPRHPEGFDQTIAAHSSHDTTLGSTPANFDATIMARPPVSPTRDTTPPGRWSSHDTTLGAPHADATVGPGQVSFESALSHLSGIVGGAGTDPGRALAGATLVANADLTVIEATSACAGLLGIPGEALIGDSLPDVFLRAVRRAYAGSDTAVILRVERDAGGSITVTFTLDKTSGTE